MAQDRTTRDDIHCCGRDHGKRVIRCNRGRLQSPRAMVQGLERYEPRRLCATQRVPIGNVGSGLRPIGHCGQGDVTAIKNAYYPLWSTGWGDPLNAPNLCQFRTFYEPPEALKHLRTALERGTKLEEDWDRRFTAWAAANPALAEEWRTCRKGALPAGWDAALPTWKTGDSLATRVAGGKALNAIATKVPWLVGGDADLAESTKTRLEAAGDFDGRTGEGNNLHYGVREHAMAAIANGMAYHGGVRPFVATFFCFSDYMRPSIRLAALNKLSTIFVWTHDSIGLGEDGPTHQAVEHLMSLRVMPDFAVIRPGDATETAEAWRSILEHRDGAVGLVLCRQNIPVLDRATARGDATRGGYVLAEASGGKPKLILLATGSELHVAVAARQTLEAAGVPTRVVSMPCWEFFDRQPRAYRDDVLPAAVRARVSIEAGVTLGWQKYVGDGGGSIGVDRFGASAPGDVVMREYGITADHVVTLAHGLLKKTGEA